MRNGVRYSWPGALAVVLLVAAPLASGGGDSGTIARYSADGDVCNGLVFETFAGAVTRCAAPFPGVEFGVAADGTMVASGERGLDGYRPVTLVRPDGQVTVVDSSQDDFDPAITPDGSKVVFARYVGDPASPSSDIYTVNSDGSDLKEVASGGGVALLTGPTFSRDGSSVAYDCEPANPNDRNSTFCGPLPDGSSRTRGLMLMNADGNDKRMIVVGVGDFTAGEPPSWSPNGQWIAMTGSPTVGGNAQVFAYRTDGSDLFNINDPSRQITHESDAYGALDPQFSADGSQIVFFKTSDQAASWNAYTVNLDGSDEHRLPLSSEGRDFGEVLPGLGGSAPPATVNAMRVRVPAVAHLSYARARHKLVLAHLTPTLGGRRFSDDVPSGHVMAQFPRAGAHAHRLAKKGPTVKLVLSRGLRPQR